MLSYQHAYHAGNHADILKHYVLTFVLSSLNKKEKPYTFFDTHAGSGLYDLLDNRSLKTGEAENGIKFLFKQLSDEAAVKAFPESFNSYVSIISRYLDNNKYPGSPELEKLLLRSQDFLILSELHPQEYKNLSDNIKPGITASLQIHNKNGFEVLKAFTPPKTKRGAVLIDPSYEEVSDYNETSKTIINIHKKWSNGIIMLWYPLLAHRSQEIRNMINSIISAVKNQNANTEISKFELLINSEDSHKEVSLEEYEADKKNPPRLYGSGMLVINSPWHLQEEGEAVVQSLTSMFYKHQ